MTGKGQPIKGFTWYYVNTFYIMSMENRLVTIRTPKKDALGMPICLVDKAPLWIDGIRSLIGQNCGEAAQIADGRETWRMVSAPRIHRWENDDSSIC